MYILYVYDKEDKLLGYEASMHKEGFLSLAESLADTDARVLINKVEDFDGTSVYDSVSAGTVKKISEDIQNIIKDL